MTRRDERGSALVPAIGVLSLMTLLATMSLMAGGADLVISTRLARESSAFYAAESALEIAMEELAAGGGSIPEESLHAPWPPPEVAVRRWRDGAWECSRRVCLIPDDNNADGDPATTVVLFDKSFGHASAPLQHGGYPVFQLLVTAESGENRQAIVAEVAPVTCAPAVTAAWMAAGPLDLSGDVRVEGTTNLSAVSGRGPVRLFGGAVIDGDLANDPAQAPPGDLLRFLNAGGSLSRLDVLAEPSAGGDQDGLLWSRGDYAGPLSGKGIFIVHNPAFDPVKHEASRIAIEEGAIVDGYDPAYGHLDPSRQPARLDIPAGGAFEGLIIADVVGGAGARFTLTGALLTLTRSPLTVAASSPLRIIGSTAAIERSGRGPLRHRLGSRSVTAPAQMQDQCP